MYAARQVAALDDSLDQESVFNRLTGNGAAQGIYIVDGQLYVNMSYARSGTLVLGGLNDAIETPRLKTPRVKIPAGSVGIAGKQTGVYPIDSPGGWQLIGRTPLKMYDADREKPILPEAGQYIKFVPIDRAEFDRIAAEVEKGTYEVRHYPKKEA